MTGDNKDSPLWRRPSARWAFGIPLGAVIAFFLGAAALGAFNWTIHQTSSNEFCYVCHSHQAFIRPEYESSSHFRNASGVRADCADCHLPHEWFDLVVTKAIVSLDIIPELMGKIDTAEKYAEHRGEFAEQVWAQFRANDSKFCRNCHNPDAMNAAKQSRMAARVHANLEPGGKTCIDCHRALVHKPAQAAAN
jgi:nitrate/TMAO reductase-like tetraheme cytochrome c subunit